MFLAGPTGTGKTEIVKGLSELVFGDQSKIIRFDMSEYNHAESDQKLIGSAPGYVGYEAGGQLTNAVMENPFSILLFDEIEKANGKVLDKFLQILEDGRLTSSKGELVDFSETFIVFTSNIGAKECNYSQTKENIRKHFFDSVVNYFKNELGRPELLNRIGTKNIIPFNPIKDKEIAFRILEHKLSRIIDNIKNKKNIFIKPIMEEKKSELFTSIHKTFNSELGGRGLVAQLETLFVDPFSRFMFENSDKLMNINNEEIVNVVYDFTPSNNKIEFRIN
ncbi:AAA family ATPase [Mycoplasma zalophidermidis]|uniref:AAA family ATPase n=1 Tax=Mycoplasma zalophidermidis TaxID=398174 RepID=A0ABS6DRZ9_9MOLU|nr:AAA family ATPase [Mycoplasma zalophidermidis]MBU4693696.1 AAA family ATPase [Mycoplasma zalophidermidis]